MAGRVCIDASFTLAMLLPGRDEPDVMRLWQSWLEEDVLATAPPLLFAEVTSVLREKVFHGQIPVAEGDQTFSAFRRLRIESVAPLDLQDRAWELAKRYNRPRAYDVQYLAVAESFGCDLWTADRRLANAVRETWVRLAR